jgi:hypothetical protein
MIAVIAGIRAALSLGLAATVIALNAWSEN